MAAERLSYNHTPIAGAPKEISSSYIQSKSELNNLPQTTLVPDRENKSNMPNIYDIKAEGFPVIWVPGKAIPPRFIFIEKADDGGVGGHVEASAKLKSTILEYVLNHNRWKDNKPIFTSLFATHTGDDVAITGIFDAEVMEHQEVVAELLWDAFKTGEKVAVEQGLYGPGQDLKADAFTGNIHGLGPASIVLPLPVREKDPSVVVVAGYADKTEPGAYNHVTAGAYLDTRYNTGRLIAESKMKDGYIFEIADLNTKEQAYEERDITKKDKKGLNSAMEELGKSERFIQLDGKTQREDIEALLMDSARHVISKIYTKDKDGKPEQLGVVVSAERLHNILTKKGFTYGGKDDPVFLSLAQGDWPAPGEISSPMANTPIVSGDCRGSHYLHIYPSPINSQTSYWSGPIVSMLGLSVNIHTGRIGAISDQFAYGTPWDTYRSDAARKMLEFRNSQKSLPPGILPPNEMEYHRGYNERMDNIVWQRREVK